jgi:hypothetical protein
MARENKTIDETYNILYEGFCSKFGQTFRLLPKSFIHILCKITAGLFIICYRDVAWWGLQQYPEKAYYGNVSFLGITINPLIMLGDLYGAGEPKAATQWQGKIAVTVTSVGSYLYSGTQLKSNVTGKIYLTEETVLLEGEQVVIPVKCAAGGTVGNLDIGDNIDFVSALGTVGKTAIVSEVVKDGNDEETEAEYRRRVTIRFNTKLHGGSYADYRERASEVTGVLQTYIYGDCEEISGENWTSTGVIIFVAGEPELYPDRIPDAALLKQVGLSCTYDPETGLMRKMLGQVIDPLYDESFQNVRPVVVKPFDVFITGLTGIDVSDFIDGAKAALNTYFDAREPYIKGLTNEKNITNKITYNNVAGVMNEYATSVGADYLSIELKSNGEDVITYTLGYGELSKLGTFYIDGVPV